GDLARHMRHRLFVKLQGAVFLSLVRLELIEQLLHRRNPSWRGDGPEKGIYLCEIFHNNFPSCLLGFVSFALTLRGFQSAKRMPPANAPNACDHMTVDRFSS